MCSQRREASSLWYCSPKKGIVCWRRCASTVWLSTRMIHKECFNVWIWLWTFTKLVLPVQAAYKPYQVNSNLIQNIYVCIGFSRVLTNQSTAKHLTTMKSNMQLWACDWFNVSNWSQPLINECSEPWVLEVRQLQFVTKQWICLYKLLQFN